MSARPQGGWPPLRRTCGRLLAALALAAGLTGAPRIALADENQEFDVAKGRMDAGQYDEAAKLFATMLDPKNPPCAVKGPTLGGCHLADKDLVEQARMNYGTLLFIARREKEADAQFAALLRANPSFRPSSANFPQAACDRFGAVLAQLKPELDKLDAERIERDRQARIAAQLKSQAEKDRIKELERLASQETVVDRSSRLLAMLPFGVGQFQNGDQNLGWLFLTTEVLTGAAGVVTAVIHEQTITNTIEALATAKQQSEGGAPDLDAVNSKLKTVAAVNQVSVGIFAGLAVVGVLQAQIGFVPTRTTTRPRKLPPAPRPAIAPTVSVGPGGASLGLVGRF